MNNECLKLVFDIITAIGSLATFGSFIFLFRRDNDKQKQIDHLSSLVNHLNNLSETENKRLNLLVIPDLRIRNSMYQGTDGELQITIENIGEKAILKNFNLTSDDIILHNEHLPYVMEKDTDRKIFARTKTPKHIKDSSYIIEILFTDKLGNDYKSVISGKGANCKMSIPPIKLQDS